MNINRRFTRFAMVCVATSFSTLCAAQSEPILEEIIVTATKRATSLQDTPLAISAFSQETLSENHVTNIYDLRGMVPTLQIRSNGDHDVPLIFIRGQGAIDQTEAGDQAVAFYTDGVFAARSQGSLALMYDLERVEVLRGPQGTLFGRNSTAGAVALHTAMPTDAFDAGGSLTLGSRRLQETQFMLNTPITDSWALRFAGISRQQDGDTDYPIDNLFQTHRNYGTTDLTSYRVSSLFSPSSSVRWFLSYEQYSNQGTGDLPSIDQKARVNDATQPGVMDLVSDNLRTRLDVDFAGDLTFSYIGGMTEFSQSQLYGNQFQGDYRETVWSTHEATQHELQFKNSDDNRFRWTAGIFLFEEDNGIRFDIPHAGAWGFPDPPPPQTEAVTLSTFVQPSRTLDSTSFYAQGTFDIIDTLRITLGARQTEDEREDVGGRSIDCTANFGPGPLPTPIVNDPDDLSGAPGCYYRQINDMQGEWDNTTYLARLEWDLSDDMMLFASLATGWKSGVLADGQNTLTQAQIDAINSDGDPNNDYPAGQPVNTNESPDLVGNNRIPQQPEENRSLEFGLKSAWMDGRMTFNANVFLMDYEDMQVTAAVITPSGPNAGQSTLTKTNAGSASISGIEFELSFLVGDAGLLTASGAFLDATYDEFLATDTIFGDERGRIWNPCGIGVDVNDVDGDGNVDECLGNVFDFSGNTLPNAPEFAFNIAYKHDIAMGNGAVLTPRIRVSYQDDTFLTQENRGNRPAGTNTPTLSPGDPGYDPGESNFDTQEAYAKFDFSVSYTSADERWGAELFINNAYDESIRQETFFLVSGGNESAYVWAPGREAGVRLNFSFD